MAKIYEWTYKGDSGKIIAANTKEAKRAIAKSFGNAIKIPKGTVVKKIGIAKVEKIKTIIEVPPPLVTTVPTSIDESYVITKEQKFTGVSMCIDNRFMYVGDETVFIAPRGSHISNVKRV